MDERFWGSTRGRIILLLLRESRTVNELAHALNLTGNGVRSHLTALERDGLVRQGGSRPGKRKPTITYDLTAKAKLLFPKVYDLLASHLLDVLKERVSSQQLEKIMREVGHRLAPIYRPMIRVARAQDDLERAIALLRELGGFCERHDDDGKILLQCFECPFAETVASHSEVCLLVETLLADVLEVTVHQRCESGPPPKCRFEIQRIQPEE